MILQRFLFLSGVRSQASNLDRASDNLVELLDAEAADRRRDDVHEAAAEIRIGWLLAFL